MNSDQRRESFRDEADGARFATTRWSVVLTAADSDSPAAADALERLCRTYWPPVYAFVRRQGYDVPDAKDLTQEFFARLLDKRLFALADRERGRFRTFLLAALRNFLVNEWHKAHTVSRGGRCALVSLTDPNVEERLQVELAAAPSPEKAYEKRWVATLLESVLGQLRHEAETSGRRALFERLKDYLWGDASQLTYGSIATELGMSEEAVKVAAHRLRRRFREVLRAEIAHTVARFEEIDDELNYLFQVVSE